jgi:hypothetical protein
MRGLNASSFAAIDRRTASGTITTVRNGAKSIENKIESISEPTGKELLEKGAGSYGNLQARKNVVD